MSLASLVTEAKCCNNVGQCYLIQYTCSTTKTEKLFSVCSKCLSQIKCLRDDISKILCIHCNNDVTEKILKIISENPIKKEFVN